MSLLPIVLAPDRRLKVTCKPVELVDDQVRALMHNMLETMYDAPGVGLAAPQVGDDHRIIVVDVAREGEEPAPHLMANPEITWASDETVSMEEGCLSLPDVFVDISRPAKVRVAFRNENNEPQELEADGLFARCIQHEIDHLNGVLHVDYWSKIRRDLTLRKLSRLKGVNRADAAKKRA
ncbi:MAG: peptide deformylase [Alphaproteobacteria bacterium]|jgi:peptide deformylase